MGRSGRRWRMVVVDMVVLRDALVLSFFLVWMAVVLFPMYSPLLYRFVGCASALLVSWISLALTVFTAEILCHLLEIDR